MNRERIVIIGASLTGATAAATLREEGFDGAIDLIGAEAQPPYNRPPLSKEYLRGEARFEDQLRAMAQITGADNVAGEMDYLLTIVARDVAELQQVLARLATHGGERLVTYLRLEEVKPPSPLPLAPTPPAATRARRAR